MPLYRRSDSGPWWYRFKVGGLRYRGSTFTWNRKEAEEAERRARAAIEADAPRGATGREVDLAQLMEWDIERSATRGTTPEWRASLTRQWTHITDYFDARTPAQRVTYERLQQYVAHRRAHVCGETIARELQTLGRGIEEAKAHGRYVRPLAKWPSVARESSGRGRGRFIPPEILRAWMKELSGDALDEARIVILTGLRDGEVNRLEWGWVERAPKGSPTPYVIVCAAGDTKDRDRRTVGLPRVGMKILRRLAARRTGRLFPHEHKTARRLAAERIGWSFTPSLRDLRHTHSTLAGEKGDIRGLQAALGHGDLETTERYLSATVSRAAAPAANVQRAVRVHSAGVTPKSSREKSRLERERATGLEPATLSLGTSRATLKHGVPTCPGCLMSVSEGLDSSLPHNEGCHNRGAQRRRA